jgi:hypothetical protein
MGIKVHTVQTNFTAGELSTRMRGRVDVTRYQNGADTIENGIVLVQGGVERRPGFRFVAESKTHASRSIVVPYVFSVTQSYVLEFGNNYIRFYRDNAQLLSGGLPYEITSPYTSAMLDELSFSQGGDTLFLYHPDVPVHRLRRFADIVWKLEECVFDPPPVIERGTYHNLTITLGATGLGATTATASAAFFTEGDRDNPPTNPNGREIHYQDGVARITSITSPTSANVEITYPFSTATLPANGWTLEGQPTTALSLTGTNAVGETVQFAAVAGNFLHTGDLGAMISINGGLVEITVQDTATPTNDRGVIRQKMTGIGPTFTAQAGAWSIQHPVWSEQLGYPRTGTLYQQRHWLGGSPAYPTTFWSSRSGLYYDFELGPLDDNAISYIVSSDQQNPIRHLSQLNGVVVNTFGGEFSVRGGVEKGITPTNIQVDQQSPHGASDAAPVRVGGELMFVQRAKRKLRALIPSDIDSSQFSAPDITVLAEHISESGFHQMVYQQVPDPVLWCVREDGVIAGLTIDKDQDVVGWHRHTTDGAVESACIIPVEDGEQVWLVVNRTISGSTKRYIERMDQTVSSDSCVTGTSGPGAATWSGLSHLNGKTVAVVADGCDMGDFVVSGGAITLPRTANAVEIGLPYTTRIKTLPPEVPTQVGSPQVQNISLYGIAVRVKDTSAMTINGVAWTSRGFGTTVLDQPLPSVSTVVSDSKLGWRKGEATVEIQMTRPFKGQVLSVVQSLQVND